MRFLWVFLVLLMLGGTAMSQGEQVSEIPSANLVLGNRNLPTCLKVLNQTSIQYEKERKANNELRSKLAECQSKRTSLTDKLGWIGMGAVVAYTNFNPISLIAAGYLVITQ